MAGETPAAEKLPLSEEQRSALVTRLMELAKVFSSQKNMEEQIRGEIRLTEGRIAEVRDQLGLKPGEMPLPPTTASQPPSPPRRKRRADAARAR